MVLTSQQATQGEKVQKTNAISNYVADFYYNECKLAIELDGKFHVNGESKERDRSRSASLNELGITVLRFWNHEVLKKPAHVLKKIAEYLN